MTDAARQKLTTAQLAIQTPVNANVNNSNNLNPSINFNQINYFQKSAIQTNNIKSISLTSLTQSANNKKILEDDEFYEFL